MSDEDEKIDERPAPAKPGQRKKPNIRRQSRTLALQVLYEKDQTEHPWEEVLDRSIEAEEAPNDVAAYVGVLIKGIVQHQHAIDREIELAAPAFPLAQLSPVDRNTLRIA